jgi:lactoylglutathione lyase
MTKPFKILGIQQVAIGGPDKNKLKTLWVDMFGLEMTGTFKSERETLMKTFVPWARVFTRWKWI